MKPVCPVLKKSKRDEEFYDRWWKGRLPHYIFDFHIHLNLPEHIPEITEERIHSDWAFEAGLILPCETAVDYGSRLFPDSSYEMAGFPWPIQEAYLKENNAYLLRKKEEGLTHPFMAVSPDFSEEYIEQQLPSFRGFKPYPDLVSTVKGAEISIFSFMPEWQLKILNRHKKAVVIHLPRKNRIADPNNIKELLEMRQKFPDIQIVIAHFGRSYNLYYLQEAFSKMGKDIDGFFFDTAAVLNPAVYRFAFEKLPSTHIFYGTDSPIMLWHGKRMWLERTYTNLVQEPFSWNHHIEGKAEESQYVLFLYEQAKVILDVIDQMQLGQNFAEKIFYKNSKSFFEI